jgi:Major intrinsic protein
MIFFFTSSPRTARWTPLGNWLLVATLVWQGAPYTGTSLNPARSLAPALLAPELAHLWVYLIGPLAGALLAAVIFAMFPRVRTLTTKLFHDPRTMASDLPTRIQCHQRCRGRPARHGRHRLSGSTSRERPGIKLAPHLPAQLDEIVQQGQRGWPVGDFVFRADIRVAAVLHLVNAPQHTADLAGRSPWCRL